MTHLGSLISALADGQLPPDQTERALAHVAGCAQCAAELAAARAARATLAGAADLQPAPDLTARLLALGAAPPQARPRPGSASLLLPGSGQAAWTLRGDVTRPRRSRVPAVVGIAAGGLIGVLFVLGSEPEVEVTARPAAALAALHEASVAARTGTGDTDLAQWLADHPWARSVPVPDGYRVAATRTSADQLEVDLAGPDGLVVVTQTRGLLAAGLPAVEVAGRSVHTVGDNPWCVAWQSGDAVVSVLVEGPRWAATPVVAAYPVVEHDDGATARVGRGWQVLLTAWSGP